MKNQNDKKYFEDKVEARAWIGCIVLDIFTIVLFAYTLSVKEYLSLIPVSLMMLLLIYCTILITFKTPTDGTPSLYHRWTHHEQH